MNNIAYKIVEFWYITEFLSQEAFPQDTRANVKNVNLVTKIETDDIEKKNLKWISKFILFHNFPLEQETSELLKKENDFYKNYPLWSSALHLCIGKVKRESLVRQLYQCLQLVDDRPEEDHGEICLIGLKIDKDGVYENNSFSLSPLLWGIYQCSVSKGKISEILTKENYDHVLETVEGKISKTEPLQKKDIKSLYDYVFDQYIKPIPKNVIESSFDGSFVYTRYDNEETFKNEDDKAEDISNLVKNFYTDDLAMIKESLKQNNDDSGMYSDIQDYIVSAWRDENTGTDNDNRIDIRNDKKYIEKWLYVDKAPYGKWPSKFKPALMQQIAINIGISKDTDMKNIFSVNGPPGTGKTTLLKEIIASTIVERAKFLCKYDKADDAFKKCHFEHGNFANTGYDQYCNKYYVFKDEELSDFSMLVASCNNAAVENITKELPDGKALLSGLKTDKKDSEDLANGLADVADLFDLSKSTTKLEYKDRKIDSYIKTERNDVYFSWLAYKLMYPKGKEENYFAANAWGLISAPMGKASNIKKYCNNVLEKIVDDFYHTNAMVTNRHENYKLAKQEFSKQLLKVEQMEKELTDISRLSETYRADENSNKSLIEEKEKTIDELVGEIQRHLAAKQIIENKISDTTNNIMIAKQKKEELAELLQQADQRLYILDTQKEIIKEKLVQKEDSRKWYEILFSTWMNTERLRQISELKKEMSSTNQVLELEEQAKRDIKDKYSQVATFADEEILAKLVTDLKKGEEFVLALHKSIREEKTQIENIKIMMLNHEKKWQSTLHDHSTNRCVIDKKFWDEFDDETSSTNIQTSNPWVTEEYNREREKLFYFALQLHKEFILSSIACRDNFKNLLMRWRCRENHENEICMYSQKDKDNSYSHLLNTLFLLTPVMSTTFASVGRFLGNIKEQGRLGLLIIDEAGQAAPQVALGALWRCKKAIVVGDPKQVEPVVTAEADAIKHGFADEDIQPYISKTISVQEFADKINKYGSFIKDPINENADPTWVGCPLVVHRRCINPMFTISNQLSYGGTMKIQTMKAKTVDEAKFVMQKSCWINVSGKANGKKNHFIQEQGEQALDIIVRSFEQYKGSPDLYVISPFTTVISGIRNMVKQSDELRQYKGLVQKWLDDNCGTVHKFQGKEAKEVIFLLGCDEKANGAVNWVKPNIVNVATTRAKYRLYIIGDYEVWKKSKIFKITKNILDTYNLKEDTIA